MLNSKKDGLPKDKFLTVWQTPDKRVNEYKWNWCFSLNLQSIFVSRLWFAIPCIVIESKIFSLRCCVLRHALRAGRHNGVDFREMDSRSRRVLKMIKRGSNRSRYRYTWEDRSTCQQVNFPAKTLYCIYILYVLSDMKCMLSCDKAFVFFGSYNW
jgi:hypothetical protein